MARRRTASTARTARDEAKEPVAISANRQDVSTEPARPPSDEPERAQVVLTRPAALGLGTRPEGFVVGTAVMVGGGFVAETFEAAADVFSVEAANALLNTHMLAVRPIKENTR